MSHIIARIQSQQFTAIQWRNGQITYSRQPDRLAELHRDARPFGNLNYTDLDYWHKRCEQLGIAWSTQRIEFMLDVAAFKAATRKQAATNG